MNRAQFGTVLSRLLFGDTYNIKPGERTFVISVENGVKTLISKVANTLGISSTPALQLVRYSKHLQALKDHGIMKKIETPMMLELRGYVMLMLMRGSITKPASEA